MGARFLKEGRTKKEEEEGGEKICVGDVEEGRSVDAKASVEILDPSNPCFLLLVGILYQEREKRRKKIGSKKAYLYTRIVHASN